MNIEIPNYEILQALGTGAMGKVYLAKQINMDRKVALKVLSSHLVQEKGFIDRFFREARAAGQLNHPHIVQGYDVGQHEGIHYFAMEYVAGKTLKASLEEQDRLSEARCLQITIETGEALEHARQHNIVHRDLKPDNIMITQEGYVKVCDLGLAKQRFDSTLTATHVAMGSPAFMSPEQSRGAQVLDTRSDLYSLGISLFQMSTGKLPFQGDSPLAIIHKHLYEPPPDPRTLCPNLSVDFTKLILKLLAKDPTERFQTPMEMVKAARAIQSGEHPEIRTMPATDQKTEIAIPVAEPQQAHAQSPVQHHSPHKRRRHRSKLQRKLESIPWPAVILVGVCILVMLLYWMLTFWQA